MVSKKGWENQRQLDEGALWHEIKRRYMYGENIKTIAKDMDEVTEKQIYNKSSYFKWHEEKLRIEHAVMNNLEDKITDVSRLACDVALRILEAYLDKGEFPKGHATVLNQILRLTWPNVQLEPEIITDHQFIEVPFDMDRI